MINICNDYYTYMYIHRNNIRRVVKVESRLWAPAAGVKIPSLRGKRFSFGRARALSETLTRIAGLQNRRFVF